jgi:hypothetical protein
VAIEIHIFENGSEDETERKIMLDMQVASPAIAAMNLRALAAELDKQSAPDGGAGTFSGAPKARAKRSDAGQKRGPVVSAPVEPVVSPFAAPAQP